MPARASRPRCTPGCGSTRHTRRTSQRSRSAASRFVGPVDGAARRTGTKGSAGCASPRTSSPRSAARSRGRRRPRRAPSLVTAGPTHEPIDPVRFIGNRSSGKMGVAVARRRRARRRVTLILGPVAVGAARGCTRCTWRPPRRCARRSLRAVRRRRRGGDGRRRRRLPSERRGAETKLKKEPGAPELAARTDARHPARAGGARGRPGARRVRGGDRGPRGRGRGASCRAKAPGPDRRQRGRPGRDRVRLRHERRDDPRRATGATSRSGRGRSTSSPPRSATGRCAAEAPDGRVGRAR